MRQQLACACTRGSCARLCLPRTVGSRTSAAPQKRQQQKQKPAKAKEAILTTLSCAFVWHCRATLCTLMNSNAKMKTVTWRSESVKHAEVVLHLKLSADGQLGPVRQATYAGTAYTRPKFCSCCSSSWRSSLHLRPSEQSAAAQRVVQHIANAPKPAASIARHIQSPMGIAPVS